MLNVTALLGRPSASDDLRYGRAAGTGARPGPRAASGDHRAPVVVWNCTRTCNLACRHCYSDSHARAYDQLTGDEAREMITDIARMGAPALLFSGGEPLVRRDVLALIAHARAVSGLTPYARFGNTAALLLSLTAIALIALRHRRA